MLRKSLFAGAAFALLATAAQAQETPPQKVQPNQEKLAPPGATAEPNNGVLFNAEKVTTEGSVSIRGQQIPYTAVAGTIIVHPRG